METRAKSQILLHTNIIHIKHGWTDRQTNVANLKGYHFPVVTIACFSYGTLNKVHIAVEPFCNENKHQYLPTKLKIIFLKW